MKRFATIVLGLGAMGSATLYQLAKRGQRVLGIDRYSPPHEWGSTHGDTRITRLAIGEGAQYTPLALRSHEIWRELERVAGVALLTTNGGLVLSSGARSSRSHSEQFFANTVAAAQRFGIPHELLDAPQIRRRFPQFNIAADESGYFEPSAGFLRPEACVHTQLVLAEHHGADLHRNELATGFDVSEGSVMVVTDRDRYAADRLIVTAGPWISEIAGPDFCPQLEINRQVLLWFDIDGPLTPFLPQNFPVFIWELQGKRQGIYGFPAIDGAGGGLKVATEQYDANTSPSAVERKVTPAEIQATFDDYVAPYLIGLSRRCLRATTCLYTLAPDFGFVVDTLEASNRVMVASPCSGHGFKHSAAIGEALAEWAVDGSSRQDLSAFARARFTA